MKKIVLPIAIGISLFVISCSPSKEQTRTEFVEKCKTEAYRGASTDEQKQLMDDYCNCAADKLLAKFSAKEIADMEKPEKQAELQEKMLPVVEPCLQEMTTKMMSTMQLDTPLMDSVEESTEPMP